MKIFVVSTLCIITAVISQKTFYVDQSVDPTSPADGTQTAPYPNLALAFQNASETTNIILVGSTYTVQSKEEFKTDKAFLVVINIQAREFFTLKFANNGQISCINYLQNLNENPVKNVNISLTGINIESTSSASSLFSGDCFFTLQDIYIDYLNTSLMSMGNEGSPKLINVTIMNISLNDSQSLIDQDSRERIEADYLILENVHFINQRVNNREVYTMIRSFLQYSNISVKDSVMEGVGFSIKGEQIGGNNKTDITVRNTVMKNAKNFFFIESYGIVIMENSTFINATNRAMHYFLTDENLSPISIIYNNCSFENNSAELEGAALAFQGSKETSSQFTLNLTITKTNFTRNQASLSGGAIAFLLLKNGNITVSDSEFISNTATEGGGAIHVDKGENTMSFDLHDNNFDSNTAFTGGVFNFEFMNQAQITLNKNSYTKNVAAFEGGIGFISESDLILKDSNSNGTLNSADFEGGAWSIKGESKDIAFENIVFRDTSAKFRGGCIFNSAASLTLKTVTFQNCSTSESGSSGGALFISEDAIIKGTGISFLNNQAESGASLAFQSTQTNQNHTFTDTNFEFDLAAADIKRTVQSQIESNQGGLVFTKVIIPILGTPFLSHTSGNISLEDVQISKLTCATPDNSLIFCLFDLNNQGTDQLSFKLNGLSLQTVSSSVPLMISSNANIVLNSIKITDVISTAIISVGSFDDSQISVNQLELSNIDSNFMQITGGSVLEIMDGKFDNEAKRNDPQSAATQFIISSGSTIDIQSTVFNFNSYSWPDRGGAIKLTNPVNLTLKNVNFTENKASNGGALFIEGYDVVGTIYNCNFMNNAGQNDNNSTPGFGGAIYIQNSVVSSRRRLQDSQTELLIQDTNFEENSAYVGGAIYTLNSPFKLQNDTFISNKAVTGGAIAVDVQNSAAKIPILTSTFKNNNATLYGSGILELRDHAVSLDKATTFNDINATFSGGAPAKIKIRAFSYVDGVQYLEDTQRDIAELLNNDSLTLIYDSFIDKSPLLLENITSGGNLSKLIEISIHDADDYNLTELSGANNTISLEIVNPVYPANSLRSESSLAGITSKDLINGSVTFLQEINVFGFPTSLLPIKVTANIIHKNLGNLEYNLDNMKDNPFEIKLLNCSIGEIFRKETLICDPCKPDYFSLTDPFTTSVCQKCDTSRANCTGGSKIYPNKGYWRIGIFSDNVVECPNPDACLGGEMRVGNQTKYNLTGFCDEENGYEGNACARCKPGFGKFGGNDQCTNCRNDPGYYVKLVVLIAIQLSLIIFNVYSNLGLMTEKDKTKEKLTIYQSTVIKVVVDYAQVLGIVASIQIAWPIGLGDFGSIVSKSVPSSKDAFSIDCFFSIIQGTNDNVFFYKILILNIQPFAFFLFGTAFWILITKIRGQSLHGNPQFRNNLLVTNCLIAYVLQPEIVKSTLQLFKCINLGPLGSPQNFLEKDLQVECGETTHLAWALGIGVPSLVFWLAFPIFVFTRIMFRVKHYNDKETLDRYHFVFKRYKEHKIYWDLYIIIRKAALIFFLVFLNDLYSQIFFSFAVFIFSLHLHYKKEPYNDDFNIEKYGKNTVSLNNLETLGLMSNCFLLFGGLFFIEEEKFGVVHGFLMAIAFLVNLIFIFRVLKAFFWVFRIKARIFLDSKKKPKQSYVVTETQEKPQELPFVGGEEEEGNENRSKEKEISLKKSGDKEDLHEESIKLFQLDEHELHDYHANNQEDHNISQGRPKNTNF